MLELVIRVLFFFIIILGLSEFCFVKLKVKSEFIPITVFSTIGLTIFSAGILNIIFEVFMFMVLFSLSYLLYSFCKKEFTLKFLTSGIIYFLIFSTYLAFFLRGVRFFAYDDFSHWGLIARDILATNQFPNFESSIMFQAYPTGSASFIYFVSKIIGDTEGVMLYAQSLLTLSCIIPLFAFIKKQRVISYIIIFISSIFFLTSNVGFMALSVDTLLAMLSLGCSAIIVYGYREKKYRWVYLQILPILSFLIVIKNSGIIFVIINVFLLVFCSLRYEFNKKNAIEKALVTIGVPYIFSFLWKRHVQQVFSQGLETKHAMSIENYQNIFHEKSITDIKVITTNLIKRSVDLNQTEIKIFVLCLVSFVLMALLNEVNFLNYVDEKKISINLFLSSVILYIIYQCGLLSTYIFSMPLGEALSLASYERYNMTFVMYIFGIYLIQILSILNYDKLIFTKNFYKVIFLLGLLLIVTLPMYWKYSASISLFEKTDRSNKDRLVLETAYNKNSLETNGSYIIYISNDNEINKYSYFYYVAVYELRSRNIKIITKNEIDEVHFDQGIEYIFILRDDKLINEKIKNIGINQYQQLIQFK